MRLVTLSIGLVFWVQADGLVIHPLRLGKTTQRIVKGAQLDGESVISRDEGPSFLKRYHRYLEQKRAPIGCPCGIAFQHSGAAEVIIDVRIPLLGREGTDCPCRRSGWIVVAKRNPRAFGQ